MIPPSIHPDGSRLNFTDINQDAPEVEYADLLKSVLLQLLALRSPNYGYQVEGMS